MSDHGVLKVLAMVETSSFWDTTRDDLLFGYMSSTTLRALITDLRDITDSSEDKDADTLLSIALEVLDNLV